MVTLNEVYEFLCNCESEDPIRVDYENDCLEIYRFDGEPVDDYVLVAKIDKDFNIIDGNSVATFNDGYDYFDDIETASVKDVVRAILGNIKTLVAENTSIIIANINWIDELLEKNGMYEVQVITCNGQKFYAERIQCKMKDYLSVMIIKSSDMQALYIDGEKQYEDHKIETDLALFDLINSAIYTNCGGDIESIDFGSLYVTDEYAENVGFPDRLEDIPDEVIDKAN